jgi:hypothetical protein
VNNGPQSAAKRLEVENYTRAGGPPVDRMGWESMFDTPEVDSTG